MKTSNSPTFLNSILLLSGVSVLYFLSARLGLLLAYENSNASPVWPPSGLALALVMILGRKAIPGIFLGALAANATVFYASHSLGSSTILIASLLIALGNTFEAFIGVYLINRFIPKNNFLESYQNFIKFIVISIAISIVTSTIGSFTLWSQSIINLNAFQVVWETWAIGDFSGILILAPLLLVWNDKSQFAPSKNSIVEKTIIVSFILFFSEAIFIQRFTFGYSYSRLYVLVPFLLWGVFRLGQRGIITCLTILSVCAVVGTISGHGPFVTSNMNDSLLELFAYISVTTITFVSLSASLVQSKRVFRKLKDHKNELEERIKNRTLELEVVNNNLKAEIEKKEVYEEVLKNNTLLLNEAQRMAKTGSWEWDIETGKGVWSDELYRVYGFEKENTVASFDVFFDILHPDDKEALLLSVKHSVKSHEAFKMEYRIINTNGIVRYIDARGEVLKNSEGASVKMMGTSQDITERKITEEKIRQLSEFQNIILNGTEYSIISTDDSGIITTFNKGAENMLGYSSEEVIGKYSPAIIHDKDEVVRRAALLTQELGTVIEPGFDTFVTKSRMGLADVNEWTYIGKNGSRTLVELSVTTLRNDKNNITGYLGIAKDITQRKRISEELEKAKNFAEESARLKEVFLANMSHEIRTPMNAIVGFNSLLKNTILNKEQVSYVSNINKASENLLSIINNILDLSKIESGLMEIENTIVHLPSLLESVHSIVLGNALEKNLEISLSLNPTLPEYVMCDQTRISQILINLTANAIKFTEKGFVNIRVDTFNNHQQKPQLKFIIQDSGIGIAKENTEIIFERFKQESSETTRKYGGSGLGLSIVLNIVKLMGGRIYVESQLEKGSEFTVIIPVDKCTDIQIQQYKGLIKSTPTSLTATTNSKELKVLLVEDNRMNQQYVSTVLSQLGYNCTIVGDGIEAIKIMYEDVFDVILMDIQMPQMDGYEATRIIRQELKSDIPIIALTANATSSDFEKCMKSGMNSYISKPYKPNDLIEKIAEACRNKLQSMDGVTKKLTFDVTNSKIKLLNISHLKDQVNGKSAAIKQLIEIFLEDTPPILDELNISIQEKNLHSIERISHQLVSSFSIIGTESAITALQTMEYTAANNGSVVKISKCFEDLKTITDQLIDEIMSIDYLTI